MGVPGGSSELRLCDRCFAMVEDGAEFCPECGAPIIDERYTEGSDAAIYPELARANLLRIRGEYKQAEEVCLAILRRFPNNATANTLLGDICAERGDLDQAAEWYELALDLIPDSQADQMKLEAVRSRMAEREASSTAKALGLPTQKSKVGLYAFGVLLFIVAVGIVTFLIGRKTVTSGNLVTAPISIPNEAPPEPAPDQSKPLAKTEEPKPEPGASVANDHTTPIVDEDRALLARIAKRWSDGSKLVSAWQDPRDKSLALTFSLASGDDARRLGAGLGVAALEEIGDAPIVSVRAVQGGKVVFIANVERSAVERVADPNWKTENQNDPDALPASVLKDPWPPQTPVSQNP